MYHDPGNTAATDAIPMNVGKTTWSIDLGVTDVMFSGPLVVNNEVYIGYTPGNTRNGRFMIVKSINQSSGETRWTDSFTEFNGGNLTLLFKRPIVIGDECLFVPYQKEIIVNGTGHRYTAGILALKRSDGAIRWHTEFGEYISQPFYIDGKLGIIERIYDVGYYYRILNPHTGEVLNSTKLPVDAYFMAGYGTTIYCGLGQMFTAFDLGEMKVVWQIPLDGGLQEIPLVIEDRVIFSDVTSTKAVDRMTGHEIWSISSNDFGRGFAANKDYLATSRYVINMKDGSQAWALPKNPRYGSPWVRPTIAGDVLYEELVENAGGTNETTLLVFNIQTGRQLMSFDFPQGQGSSPMAAIDGQLVFAVGSRVYCLGEAVPPSGPITGPPETSVPNASPALAAVSISVIGMMSLVAFANTEVGINGMLPPLFGLYTRIRKIEVLDHYTRGRIMGYLQSNPGVNYNSIKDELGLNNGALTYHLQVLEREGYIRSERTGLHKRFYPMTAKREDRISLEELVLATLRKNPGISQKDIAFRLGQNPTTIHRIIQKLMKAEMVVLEKEGKVNHCYLARETENDIEAPRT